MLRSSIIELNRRYKTILSAWLLFLMNPFSAVVVALNNLRESYTKNIVWLFVVYYGFTLVYQMRGWMPTVLVIFSLASDILI